jgi:L-asparaginase
MKQRKTIYVLSTGGTIAMSPFGQSYAFVKGDLEKSLANMPELQNADMPNIKLHEYEQLLDSANMTPDHWLQIAEHIQKHLDQYDGFVILHGTDTMAYTASALSFMLENLNKPVILTGSQLPLFKTRSDARENLINALWIAGNYSLPEVCIYFNNKLLRGNRSKKVDANSFTAFESPNFPLLAEIGAEIIFRQDLIRHVSQGQPLRLQSIKPIIMGTFRLFPGMAFETLKHSLHPSLQALILETYGLGTASENPHFLGWIKQVTDDGILVINCSQCLRAKVKISDYTTGSALVNAGAISGADMTIEAAIAKLFYLFSKHSSLDTIKKEFITDLRGETDPS